MSTGIIRLRDAAGAPISTVGGKARALGRLMRDGFEVPDGLVVAPEADPGGEDLATHLDALGAGPFVVRSSGVSEDATDSSLAGKYESLLDVDRDAVAESIWKVRDAARLSGEDTIPVLVQVMVDPVCAGVAFTADPVTGDRETTIITATGGLADRLLGGERAGDEWRITRSRAKATRRPEKVLSRSVARRVAEKAREIAGAFGAPQDVEWAWDGRELWVVQARPITGLPDDLSWDPPAPGIYQRSLRFGEWIPEPVTPLFESWLLTMMEKRLHERLHELIGQVAPEPHHVIVNGWYYYSLNWLPLPGVAFTRNLINILRRVWKDWRMAAPMFPQTVRFGYQRCEDDWRDNVLPRFREAVALAEAQVEEGGARELIDLIDQLATEAGSYFGSIATVAGSAYKFESQLAMFWNKHLKEELDVSHMVLLQGFDLPEEIHQTPRLETLDWSVPPMSPQGTPGNPDRLRAQRVATAQRAEEALARSPRRLRKFRRLLAEAQHVVPVREEQLSLLSLPWPVMRRALHRLGKVLVDSGSITSVDDIFYLTRSEVVSLLDAPVPMSKRVEERRDARDRASKVAAPLWVGRVPRIVRFMFSYSDRVMGSVRSDGAIVHGVPTSPGRATGPVRVVRNSSQFEDFEEGEVLVAPLTAPAWTELFGRASAVVTDVGSALAHASIIAREYGIPAVVGCGDATSRLKDGQIVTVDGSSGNVEPVEVSRTA